MDFKEKYNEYIEILKEELVPAMGCTEPIAIALAGAKAREVLGKMPTKVEVFCSGNVIKNAKSVTVPNTNGLFGIEAATMAGVVGGNAENRLEVLNTITDEDIVKINNVIAENICTVGLLDTVYSLHIVVIARHKEEYAKVEIAQSHTNIWKIEKNGEVLLENPLTAQGGVLTDRSVLNIQDILEFANTVEIEKIQGVIERQIEYNSQIAEVGLSQSWGAQVGKTILKKYPNSVENRAKAKASAGSDARMSGCALPV
ncbi:MAG: L-serine ammonia-lyase, iron-sulfur-dependent, subunit alpha, partial [Anaerotignaceae bacterium]